LRPNLKPLKGNNNMLFLGEIVGCFPPTHVDNIRKQRYEYNVRALIKGGTQYLFQHAMMMENVSGLLNSTQAVSMSSVYGEKPIDGNYVNTTEDKVKFTTGDRVILGIFNDNYQYPVILGFYPHPMSVNSIVPSTIQFPGQTTKFDENKPQPQYRNKINGVDIYINANGDFYLNHMGVTKVEQSKMFEKITLTSPKPEQFFGIEILEKGLFRMYDSIGQSIAINPVLKLISISNGACSIVMSQDKKTLQIMSSEKIEELCGKDWNKIIKGNETVAIDGTTNLKLLKDRTITIDGNDKLTVKGKADIEITGAVKLAFKDKIEWTNKGKIEITGSDAVTIKGSGGAGIKLDSGKVALGSSAVELLDQLVQLLTEMITAAPTFVNTGVGPGILNPTLLAKITTIKASITSIKGSL
jgi:hypothetical protein